MKNLVRFFIEQHKLANLVMVFLIGIGLLYFWQVPKEAFPPINFDVVVINTPYPGASASEVERLVTRPIEEAIEGINGKDKITSTSLEGFSSVTFQLDPDAGVEIGDVVNDIRTALDNIRNELPQELEDDPNIVEVDSSIFPVIAVIISGDADEALLRQVADAIEDEANRIDGVARVDKVDYRDREVWVEVKVDKLRQYDLEISDVLVAITRRNINLPGGKITTTGREYLIRTVGQYETLEQIKNTVVRANDQGNVVLVRDVATATLTFEDTERSTRIQGNNGIVLNILKKEGSDIIDTVDAIKGIVAEFEKTEGYLPEGVRLFTADDLSFYVKRRLGILTQNATLGLILVFLCLVFFFDIKTTFWTTLGVPIAFCTAMIFVTSMGLSLNLISMFGFIIVVGMIVDDAIVVAENIYRHREMGMSPMEAAVLGTREVFVPVTGMVCTTIVAFAPLLVLAGIMGKFLSQIPKVVIAAMVASYLECLLILPGHLAYLRQRKKAAKKGGDQTPEQVFAPKRRWFFWLQKRYTSGITLLLKRPLLSMLGMIVLSVGLLFITFRLVPFVFFAGTIDELNIQLETAKGTSINKTQRVVDEVEKNIRNNLGSDAREYISSVGFRIDERNLETKGTHYGTVRVVLNPDSKIPNKEVIERVDEEIQKVEGIEKYSAKQVGGGPPQGSAVDVQITYADVENAQKVAEELVTYLQSLPNTTSVEISEQDGGKDEYRLILNEQTAAVLGLNTISTAQAIRYAFEGGLAAVAKSMRGIDEDVDIVVKYPETRKNEAQDIKTLKVKNAFGQNITVSEFATLEQSRSLYRINKENFNRYLSVKSEVIDKQDRQYNAQSLRGLVAEKFEELEAKYAGISLKLGGDQDDQVEQSKSAGVALALALLGVLTILTSIFKSYIQPFVVMTAIPFAFVGVMLGLLFTGNALGFFPFIGMVALTGIVVNDSMVLVSFINKFRNQGMPIKEAIVTAGTKRLRPILLTTLTTSVGIAPLAYGILGEEPFLEPMAVSILWGLLFSTFVILGIIPCLYYLTDSLVQFVYRVLRIPYKIPGSIE